MKRLFSKSDGSNRMAIILDNLIPIFFHHRMQERSRRNDNGRAVRMLYCGPVLHDGPDVDHVLAILVDRSAQETHESLVGHDFLGDGVDEKSGVDKGLTGTFSFDGAFSEFNEGLAAGGLGADATLNFSRQEKGVADGCLAQGIGQSRPHAGVKPGAGLVPVAGALNAHGV